MWDKPEKIVVFLNEKYKNEGWQLEYVRKLTNGNSGALLFLCQSISGHNYVVIKSFNDISTAMSEYSNNFKANRILNLPGTVLTELDKFEGGACFTMRLVGTVDGKSFSDIVRTALDERNCSLAVKVINIVSSILRRSTPTSETREAFKDVHLDNNFHDRLKVLDPNLYKMFECWWDRKLKDNQKMYLAVCPAHGDLHADNILVASKEELNENDVHLIDFGCYGKELLLKDFARLERDIRFRLYETSLTTDQNFHDSYFQDQENITLYSGNEEEPPIELRDIVTLVRTVREASKGCFGGNTNFDYNYVRLLEFLYFAVSPFEDRGEKYQRIAAFKAAIALTVKIDASYEANRSDKEGAVLWRLGYSFLRLEQLPSGGWARSLPNWFRILQGDTEESRSAGYRLREVGGMNLTCLGFLNYSRSIFLVLDVKPENILNNKSMGHKKLPYAQDPREIEILNRLQAIEGRNLSCLQVIDYVKSRTNTEGAIPASNLVRNIDTEVHHTLLGIIVLLLAYFLSNRATRTNQIYDGIVSMCDYLISHSDNKHVHPNVYFKIHCACVFLRHLLSFEFFRTNDPDVQAALQNLVIALDQNRDWNASGEVRFAYPSDDNASEFLMNLPLLSSISGCELLEDNEHLSSLQLNKLSLDRTKLVNCVMAERVVSDWGHTAEYWWAMTRPWSKRTTDEPIENVKQDAVFELTANLSNHDSLSLTHGVSFSYVTGLSEPITSQDLYELDCQVNTLLEAGATERNILSLISWIYHEVYVDFPLFTKNLAIDQKYLEAIPHVHKLFPRVIEIKNLFISKLQPGDYITQEGRDIGRLRAELDAPTEETREFFNSDLGLRNSIENETRWSDKKWFHLLNYIGDKINTDNPWILDVGCGSGIHAIKDFLPLNFRVHFIDFSELILNRLKTRLDLGNIDSKQYKITHDNVELYFGNSSAYNGQFIGQYRLIFADGILFHIKKDNMPEILRSFHRLLLDDGYFFANFKVNDHTLIAFDGRSFEYYANYFEIQKMIEDAGFCVEDVSMTLKNASMYGSPYPTHWAHFTCSKRRTG